MSRKQKRVFWPSLALIVLAVATIALVSARAKNSHIASKSAISTKISKNTVSASPQSASPADRIETELITIRATGFDPKQITRPQGRFILAVDNRSGLEEIALELRRASGEKLQEARTSKRKMTWRKLVDLPPGNYVVTEAHHSDWICRLTITAR